VNLLQVSYYVNPSHNGMAHYRMLLKEMASTCVK